MDDLDAKPLSGPETATALWKAVDHLAKSVSQTEERALTADETAAVRLLLEQDRRTRWLWTTARTWALWIAAVIAGFTLGLDALKKLIKSIIA